MSQPSFALPETDPRFPSGPWTGYFLMPHTGSQRHPTHLRLEFVGGKMTGSGNDAVGAFVVDGSYDLSDGKCRWVKMYLAKHDVNYSGYNEGKGIWGTWEIPPQWKGGFHIWPEGMDDPTRSRLYEEADPPMVIEEIGELVPVG